METNYSHIKTIADISNHPEFMLVQGAEVKPILEIIGQWTYEDTIGGLYVLMNNGEYTEVFGFEGEVPYMGKELIDLLHISEKQVAATAALMETNYSHIKTIADISNHPEFMLVQGAEVKPILEIIGQWTYEDTIGGLYVLMNNGEYTEVFGFEGEVPYMGKELIDLLHISEKQVAATAAFKIIGEAVKHGIKASDCATVEEFAEKIFNATHISYGKAYLLVAYHVMKKRNMKQGGSLEIGENKYLQFEDLKIGDTVDFILKRDKDVIVKGEITYIDENRVGFTNLDYPNVGRHYFTKYSLSEHYNIKKAQQSYKQSGSIKKSDFKLNEVQRLIELAENGNKEKALSELKDYVSNYKESKAAGEKAYFGRSIDSIIDEYQNAVEYVANMQDIPNNYVGKTAEQVWDEWTVTQRNHFVSDHNLTDNVSERTLKMSSAQLKADKWGSGFGNQTSWDWISGTLHEHIGEGQYAKGGAITTPSGAKWNKFKADFIESAMRNGSLTKAQANELFQDFNHIMVKEFNNGEDGYSTWYAHNYQYAVEYRDMHTAIHNLITTKYPDKEKAKEIYAIVKEIENSETENQSEDLYHQLNNMDIDDTFEINFREIQDIGGNKYYGTHDQVMIINQNVPDKYAKGGNIKQPINYQKKWKVTYLTFQGTKGTKEITLGRMSNRDDVKQALKRMGTAQDLNIREVLSIDEVMEQGGSIQSVNEYLEEIFNADSFVEKFIYLTTPSRGKHLTEEELYAAFTSGQAAKVLEEYDPSAFYQLRNDMESSGYPAESEQQYAVTLSFHPKNFDAVKKKIENALEVSLDDNSMLYFDKGDDYFEIHGLTYKEEQSLEREFSDSDMAEFSSQEMAKKGMWIKKALTGNKGALRRTARQRGLLRNMDEKLSMRDLKKLQNMSPLTAKRAHLAETLRKFESGGEVNDWEQVSDEMHLNWDDDEQYPAQVFYSPSKDLFKSVNDKTGTEYWKPKELTPEVIARISDYTGFPASEILPRDIFVANEVIKVGAEESMAQGGEIIHEKKMGVDLKTVVKKSDSNPRKWIFTMTWADKINGNKIWRSYPNYISEYFDTKSEAEDGLNEQLKWNRERNLLPKQLFPEEFKQGGTIPDATVDEVLQHYIVAGLWAETIPGQEDDGDDSFDKKYSASDIAPDSLHKMREKVTEFLSENNDAVTASGLTNEEVGHSLWLTQNHHGAGFFDYSLDADVEKQLTAGADKLGEGLLEVGDDGKIHIHYGRSMKQGGNINSFATITDYLSSLSDAQLPSAAAAYLRDELLNDSTLNLLSPNDADVKAIADFISEKFETALPQPVEVGEEVPEYVPPVIEEVEEEPVFVPEPEPEPEPEPIAYSAEVTKFMDEAAMVAEILDTITGISKKDQKERAKFVDELKMIIEIVESENEQAARKMEVDYASYLGIEHKSVLGATKKEAEELADKLANAESEVNEKLKIKSGGQLYNDIYLQKQFKYEMDKKLGNLLQGKLISMDVYNLLEQDNYHALNAYLSMSGYYGKEQEVKQKNLGNAKHVYNTVLSASIYKDGGKIEPGYQLELKDWTADVYEDDFEEGEGKHVNSFSGEVNKTFGSIDDLLKYIGDRITYEDAKKENFSVNDDGRIDTSVLVDSENSPASKSEIEKWKNGELKLYNANYSFYVLLVSQKTPTVEELSSLLGIKMKKGGSIEKAPENFRYLTLQQTKNGLKITLNEQGKEFSEEEGLTQHNFSELFEDVQGNSEYVFLDDGGAMGFGLTEAPMITDGYYYEDNSNLTAPGFTDAGNDDSRVFAYMDYQIHDFASKLKENGEVFFQEVSANDGGKKEYVFVDAETDEMPKKVEEVYNNYPHKKFFGNDGEMLFTYMVIEHAGKTYVISNFYAEMMAHSDDLDLRVDQTPDSYKQGGSLTHDDFKLASAYFNSQDGRVYKFVGKEKGKLLFRPFLSFNPNDDITIDTKYLSAATLDQQKKEAKYNYVVEIRRTDSSPWETLFDEPTTKEEAEKVKNAFEESGEDYYELRVETPLPFKKGGAVPMDMFGVFLYSAQEGEEPVMTHYTNDKNNAIDVAANFEKNEEEGQYTEVWKKDKDGLYGNEGLPIWASKNSGYFGKVRFKNGGEIGDYTESDYEDARSAIMGEFDNEKIDDGFTKEEVEKLATIVHNLREDGITGTDLWEHDKVQGYLTELSATYKNKENAAKAPFGIYGSNGEFYIKDNKDHRTVPSSTTMHWIGKSNKFSNKAAAVKGLQTMLDKLHKEQPGYNKKWKVLVSGEVLPVDSMKRGGDVATASATEIDHVGIDWQSSFSPADREVIEDDVHQHVSEMVKQGFHSGELTDGGTEPSYSGWWSVDIEEDDNDADDRNNEVSEKIREGYTSGYNPNFSFGANVWNNDKPKSKKKTKDNTADDEEEVIVHAPDAIDKGDFNAASVKWFDGITKYASTPAGKQDLQGLLKIAEESSYIRQNLRKFVVEIKKTNIPQPFKKKLNSHASRINNRGFNEFEHQFGGKTKGSTKPSATEEYFKLFIQAVKANDKAQGGKLN